MYTYIFVKSVRVIPVSAVLSRVPYECLYLQNWVTPPLFGAAPRCRLQSPRAMRMATILLVLVALHMAVAETSDAPFELVLGLPLQRLDQLEKKFWAIADPGHADYLQHMSIAEVRKLIGASAADVAAAKSWLKKLGASRCVVGALGDTVVGVFKDERAARASGHWHHWVANPDNVRLPTKANHTHPLHYVLRRDHSPLLEPVSSTSCQDVLKSSCSTDAAKAHSPFSSETCGVCAGKLQHQLRVAGCSATDINAYCHGETHSRREPYDIVAQKQAYRMPTDLTATNPNTLQMVWGPGTFGFGRGGLEGFRDAHCPLLNVDKVLVDGFHGKAGGDNYGEGNLDTQMIASFGLNVTTLVSNTNTSASTEEGVGFGQAMLDFITSLASRPILPQVLSLSLGSLSPHSCGLLCSEAVKRGQSLAACQAYLQTQRQVCMFMSEAQTARIDTALQVLGVRGVSVLGSSGDGGSHWSFQAFDAEDPMGAVLNEVGCEFMFPIYPSPSPYMISIGGTQWKDGDSSKPEMWDVGGS